MKLRNYFLLSIVVGAAVACSSNEDIPEEHVFTPNATLSLATGVYGDGRTKAVGIDVTEEEKKENKIHTLDVLVFSGTGDDSVYQTQRRANETTLVPDIAVEAGSATIVVLANSSIDPKAFVGKKLSQVLEYTHSLKDETLDRGLSMSSKVIETNLTIDTHNIFGDANSFVGNHSPNEIKGGKIELYRHVAQVNLKSVKISTTNTGATFQLEEVFMANVKGYSHIASKKEYPNNWVEANAAPSGEKLWWYGDYFEDDWNGEYKITKDGVMINFLAWTPETIEITKDAVLETENGKRAVASFYVYENLKETPVGQRTLLVLKGTYIDNNGKVEKDRFYTISVNDPNRGYTLTEGEDVPKHSFVKRNYRYNISLTIKSSGSDRPYDPASEACMDVAVTVADWDVIEQNEDLD